MKKAKTAKSSKSEKTILLPFVCKQSTFVSTQKTVTEQEKDDDERRFVRGYN